ncbi:transposase family protein [Streptomyces sp. NPDC001373]|uniref:transposase family protein n=1 Tax=Streptomyces sp. NPDC001373 TaxID=3364565 RepID=UPI003693BE6F
MNGIRRAGVQSAAASRRRRVGGQYRPAFADRLLAAPLHLRHAVTHDVPACWFGRDRSTITRAVGEVPPLPAERGCTVVRGTRLRTPSEVIDHLRAAGRTATITEGPETHPFRG